MSWWFVAAQVLRYWAILTLGPSWNARGIVSSDGTVVTSGPYRFVRHPNYVAVAMEFVSLPLGGGAWISCVILNLVHVPILVRRIRGEERELAQLPGWNEHVHPRPPFPASIALEVTDAGSRRRREISTARARRIPRPRVAWIHRVRLLQEFDPCISCAPSSRSRLSSRPLRFPPPASSS